MNRSEFVKKTIKGKTLDVGCAMPDGRGSSLHEYIYNDNVYGLDIVDCPNMKNFKRGDAQNMPFKDEMFDTVVAGEVIEHLKTPDKFLKEAKRVLKRNGTLIITTPNKKSWSNRIFGNYYMKSHINLFDIQRIKKSVSKHFKIKKIFCLPYDSDTVVSNHPKFYWVRKLIHNFVPRSLQENIIVVAEKTY